MRPPAPLVLRKGAVVRVAGPGRELAAPAYAISFVDLRFEDDHLERWLGSGSLRADTPVPHSELISWGTEVALEHALSGDLEMTFSGVDRRALSTAPVEIVVAWSARLPEAG